MKKRNFLILICLLLTLAMTVVFVACNKDPVTHTVTFSADGFDSVAVTVEDGKTVTAPDTIKKDGYDAVWQKDNENFDFGTLIKSDITLTAKWVAKSFSVTLSLGGNNTKITVTYDQEYQLGVATTDEAKKFGGWKIDGTPVTDSNGDSFGVWTFTENKTAEPIWLTGEVEQGFSYIELEDETYYIMAAEGFNHTGIFGDTAIIPSEYKGKPVSTLGSMRYLSTLKVKIPASIKTISASAFNRNSYLDYVDLSDFSGTIEDMAFSGSKIKGVNLGKTSVIEQRAFENTNIPILVVPETVKSIGNRAFDCDNIMEVGFVGDFPTLGEMVFGTGKRGDDNITVIAKESAWKKLTGLDYNDDNAAEYNTAVTNKTGLTAASMRHYSDADMADMLKCVGVLSEKEGNTATDKAVVYRGLGLGAYYTKGSYTEYLDMYEPSHLYIYPDESSLARDTYLLDYTDMSVEKLEKNAKGETLKGNVLYDYQGSDVVYYVPDGIAKVAGGAGIYNDNIRFLMLGDDVTEVGSYAFSFGTLFGITFGENISKIDDFAFFGHDYLQQIIFKGQTAPTVGTGAFCTMQMGGIGPSILVSNIALYSDCRIYLTVAPWFADGIKFIDAFNASLDELGDMLLADGEGKNIAYVERNFEKLTQGDSYYFYNEGVQIETQYGTITMMGTAYSGYAFVNFNNSVGYDGVSYARYYAVPGYPTMSSTEPKVLEFFVPQNGSLNSLYLYGKFKKVDSVFVFELRGDEAGSFGDVEEDIINFDGYENFSFFGKDGRTVQGKYTKEGNTITFDDTALRTAIFDSETKKLTYKSKTMMLLGEGAGVYYDINNAASLTVDGKPTRVDGVTYDGTMTIVFDGKTTVVPYLMADSKYIIKLNGKDREWQYSKTSNDFVFQGYYGPGDTEQQLKFKVVVNSEIGSFNCGDDVLTIDGHFTATLKDDTGTKTGTYMWFGESTSLYLNIEGKVMTVQVERGNNTFTYIQNAVEAGKWYAATSLNYAWYFDGIENCMYFNGEYHFGTYVFDDATGEISIVYQDNAAVNDEKGELDIANGLGSLVYKSYSYSSSNTIEKISRKPFTPFTKVEGNPPASSIDFTTFIAALKSDGTIVSTNPYFKFYRTGNVIFVNYNNDWMQFNYSGDMNGAVLEFEYTITKDSTDITATYRAKFTVVNGITSVEVLPINHYKSESTAKSKDGVTEYNVGWIDQTHVVIWYMSGGYPYFLVSGEVAGGVKDTFTVGEYKVTGYGTDNAVVEKIAAE